MTVTDDMKPGGNGAQAGTKKKDKTHWLYIMVIAAVVLGAVIGLVAPEVGKSRQASSQIGQTRLSVITWFVSVMITKA